MKKEEFQVEDLILILSECGLTELEYEKENIKVKIKKAPQPKVVVKEKIERTESNKIKEKPLKEIVSPAIGNYFYVDPAGNRLITVGDKIKVGQNLGTISIMGIKTPIKATVSGEIVDIMVENGGVVDYGKALIKVKA
nr:biotin/lipoyl-containing protein [uncultured Cetobacterium sp.]